ncbi:MAG: hypothetical protein WB460_18850 [Candidatus Acidiferrales bacterium]
MRSRPVGITILSVLLLLNVAFYAVLAVLSIVNHDALAALLWAISPGGAGPAAVHLAMGRFELVYYGAMISCTGVLALGFWKLWNWTRIVILVLIGVNLLGAAVAPFIIVRSLVPLLRVAVSVVISILIGWYLVSAKVRAAFCPPAAERESELPSRSAHQAG